ncbi:MAG: L,D-transpeptidase [Clostridia bacterium]|nr:L,D-transpeptidase [Clostridia bacterium]
MRRRVLALLLSGLLMMQVPPVSYAEDIWDEDIIWEEEVFLEVEEVPLASDAEKTDGVSEVFTPAYGSPYTDEASNFWTLPMDITDEAAVWEMLTSPITVLDNGKKNAEKTQVVLRAAPDENAEGVGVVTCISQGVHVLETLENGWTLIECYSSSFKASSVSKWNMLVQGYVPTSMLKQTIPDQTYGIVIDKLTQRLYLFKEGALYATLLVSTGLVNSKQPWNETRSGEFLMLLPAVGGFQDGNMICSYAIRYNSGDLLHEVPHSTTSGYSVYEPKLGEKASHGCIRVQRRKTPNGVNMKYIWDNRKSNMKLVIWEDWQGRQIPYPEDSTTLYYNPKGGKAYHTSETCYSASGKTFTAFTYGELEESPYSKLNRCTWCTPPLRKGEIDAINATYAAGGDHDPILTRAREKLEN